MSPAKKTPNELSTMSDGQLRDLLRHTKLTTRRSQSLTALIERERKARRRRAKGRT